MILTLTPCRGDTPLAAELAGDVLVLNGAAFDFSALPEGGLLPQATVDCAWIASDVTRSGGHVCMTLILPHGGNAPEATRFPAPVTVTDEGPVALPLYDTPEEGMPE